jgi:phenylpyruvate tautomerase PptA (4-oxalocrotonate tautomerase family)/ketosteroid isomerase-like protein
MPVITVTLIEGYDETVRRDLSHRLTDAAVAAIGAPLDGVTVVINEVAASNYMRGRQHRTPGTPPPSASQVVQDYLSAMERRDLAAATGLLAEGFTMTFPGKAVFRRPEELVEWAKARYRAVAKIYERFDEATDKDGAVVYCFGTLHGEWPDGKPFEGIRFIDRFKVSRGRIVDQMVWNDLAEVRATPTVPS